MEVNKLKTRYLLICFSLVSIFLYPLLSSKDLPKSLGQGIVFASEISNIKLIGTVTSGNEKFNMAIIEESKNRLQSIYHKGSQLPNRTKIKSIFSDHILLEKNGDKKVLKITSGSGFDKKGLNYKGYQKISSNEWVVDPSKFFKSAEDIARLCWQTKIEADEKGLKFADLADDDFLRELGLQEGDIIEQINGNEFDNLYDALNYLWNLESGSSISISIIRKGNRQRLTFHPYYDQLPSYVQTGSITPHKISSMLTAKHVYNRTNVVYK